jgi:hypothetical protein
MNFRQKILDNKYSIALLYMHEVEGKKMKVNHLTRKQFKALCDECLGWEPFTPNPCRPGTVRWGWWEEARQEWRAAWREAAEREERVS